MTLRYLSRLGSSTTVEEVERLRKKLEGKVVSKVHAEPNNMIYEKGLQRKRANLSSSRPTR